MNDKPLDELPEGTEIAYEAVVEEEEATLSIDNDVEMLVYVPDTEIHMARGETSTYAHVDEAATVSICEEAVESPEVIVEEPIAPEPELEPEPEHVKVPYVPTRPSGRRVDVAANFYLDRTAQNAKLWDEYQSMEPIPVMPTTTPVMKHHTDHWDRMHNKEVDAHWLTTVAGASTFTPVVDEAFDDVAYRNTAHFQHILEYGGHRYGSRKLGVSAPTGSGVLTGPEAIAHISAVTDVGGEYLHYLWGSGLKVTTTTPQLGEEVQLDRAIAADKSFLGRATRGAVFSNDSFLIVRHLAKFIHKHIVTTSVEGANTYEGFLNTVKLPDFGILALYIASNIHKTGFPFSQPCLNDPHVCNHVSTRMVNILKMLVTDSTYISPKQMAMITRTSKMTRTEYDEYHESFNYPSEATYLDINAKCRVFFRVPTVGQNIASGERWLAELEQRTATQFAGVLSEEERVRHYESMRITTILRDFGHWIGSIEITQGEHVSTIVDPATIEEQLNIWSGVDDYVTRLVDAIEKYQRISTVSYAGVLNYPCPACGEMLPTEDAVKDIYYPIDPVSVFFLVQQSYLEKMDR